MFAPCQGVSHLARQSPGGEIHSQFGKKKKKPLSVTYTVTPKTCFPPGGLLHPVGKSGAGVFDSKMPAFRWPD